MLNNFYSIKNVSVISNVHTNTMLYEKEFVLSKFISYIIMHNQTSHFFVLSFKIGSHSSCLLSSRSEKCGSVLYYLMLINTKNVKDHVLN